MHLSNLRSLLVRTKSPHDVQNPPMTQSVPTISLNGVSADQIPSLSTNSLSRVHEDTHEMNRRVEELKMAAGERSRVLIGSKSLSGDMAVRPMEEEEAARPDIGALWKSTLFYGLVFVPIAYTVFR